MIKMHKLLMSCALGIMILTACTPMNIQHANRYQLNQSSMVARVPATKPISLLVMQPVAVDGYDTEQMLYVNRPYEVAEFANNVWMSPPTSMILPLMMRSIASSHYFYAVTSDLNISKTDYRLESILLRLQQNFLIKPSRIELAMQVTLIRNADSGLVGTEIISESVPCPSDNPLGGVIAANQATKHLGARVAHFVIAQVKRDQKNKP